MSDPVPATGWGPANWQDFNNNWRKADGDFLQTRSVLRYQTTAARDAITPAPPAGTVIYNFQTDRIEYRTNTSAWNALYHINGLIIEPAAPNHRVRHPSHATLGLLFTATQMVAELPLVTAGNELRFEAGGLTISTGDKDARLTTDTANLVSDTPIWAPSLRADTLNITSSTGLTAIGGNLMVAGVSTFTGLVTALGQIALPAPTATNHATTKVYVDTQRDTRVPMAGTSQALPITGPLFVKTSGATLRMSATNNEPSLDFSNNAWSQLGYIKCTSTSMDIVTDGDINLNSGGAQVRTSDPVYATGGLRGFAQGPALRLIGKANDINMEFYGAGTSIDTTGALFGYVGYSNNVHMQVRNRTSGGYLYLWSDSAGIIFTADNVERARFEGSHLLIGMASPSPYDDQGIDLDTEGEIHSTIGLAGRRNLNCSHIGTADAAAQSFVRFSRAAAGTGLGSISQNAQSGVVYNTTSDYRRKTIVGPITSAVERVMQLRPWRALFNDDEERGEVDVFVAHEAAEVIPDAVTGEKDAVDDDGKPVYQEMDYARPTPLLAAAIQELAQRVTALEGAA